MDANLPWPTSQMGREQLYVDKELGCGNFFFKARAVSLTQETPFLFLERPFVTPYKAFVEFSFDTREGGGQSVARWYISNGIEKGDVVCTFLGTGIGHFVHNIALNSIGAVHAIINNQVPPTMVARYMAQNEFETLVYDGPSAANAREVASLCKIGTLFSEEPSSQLLDLPTDWPAKKHSDDIAMICHSSGTTGTPKAIVYTHDQHFVAKRERLRQFIEDGHDRILTAMPPAHSAGISYLMTAVMLELPTFVPSELTGPSVAANITRFKPTILTRFAQTGSSLAEQDLPEGAFSSVKRFYNTGYPPRRKHIAKLLRLAPSARFADQYGSSELAMAQFERVSTANDITPARCVGRPRWFVEDVKIVDAFGKPVPNTKVGFIAVKSPTLTPGYYKRPLMTEMAKLDGYWLTGDVGYRTPEGDYYQLDRSYDV